MIRSLARPNAKFGKQSVAVDDALDQVAHLDHLDVEVAEAAAGEVEAEEGGELRHLAAGERVLKPRSGLGSLKRAILSSLKRSPSMRIVPSVPETSQ